MGIEIRIEAASVADLHGQLATLLAGAGVTFGRTTEPAPETEDKPEQEAPRTRKRAAKQEKAEQDAADLTLTKPSTEGVDAEGNEPTSTTEPGTLEYADVQKAVTQLAAAKGRDAVVSVFNQFGVDHGTKLTPDQWAPAVEALDAAREAA